jgi:site-specific DNA-methyltransferase (adenine-specific)
MPIKKNVSKEQPSLSECPLMGVLLPSQPGESFYPLYKKGDGILYEGNSLDWLKTVAGQSVDLIIADPPYNIRKAEWDKFQSQEKYVEWSMEWIAEAARILREDGTLYICGFTEILADLKHPSMDYFASCKWLIWHYRNKANIGRDWGRSHESILHLRKSNNFIMNIDDVRLPYGRHSLKYPVHPQAESSQFGNNGKRKDIWLPHPLGAKPRDVLEVPTTCNGMSEKTPHPAQKPEELLRRLVLASSNEGDVVLDPFSGSGTTLVVAEQLNRKWLGCEIAHKYNLWAINRLEHVVRKTKDEWIAFDRTNSERRSSIR